MQSARATLQGFEAMHALRKGQARAFQFAPGIQGEVRLVERCFHLGPTPMSELIEQMGPELEDFLANSA